ncbi:MAG: antitoxin VapB family protein [Candidatus Bathyarchaeia archaeon]
MECLRGDRYKVYIAEPVYRCIVISLKRYATISVPLEVKRLLERVKGGEEWGDFLLNLYNEVQRLRGERAFQELAGMLTEKDLRSILESSREFREGFRLG